MVTPSILNYKKIKRKNMTAKQRTSDLQSRISPGQSAIQELAGLMIKRTDAQDTPLSEEMKWIQRFKITMMAKNCIPFEDDASVLCGDQVMALRENL